MAEDPVASSRRAANLSRCVLMTGYPSAPSASPAGIVPDASAWEQAVKAYNGARQRHEAFLTSVLQPAYGRVAEQLAHSPAGNSDGNVPRKMAQLRQQIAAAERCAREGGGGRSEVLLLRTANPDHAHLRTRLARYLVASRTRNRLMGQHDIFALEEQGNDFREVTLKALTDLLKTPALDEAGLLLKVRVGYEEIFRHEDHDSLLGAVFADIERLFV